MEAMDKKQKKFVKKMMDSVSVLGECRCGGHLIISTKANKRNMFDVYCMDCGSVSDVRFPKAGDTYFITNGQKPIDLLCAAYKAHDRAPVTDDQINTTPVSDSVNELHGNLS